MAVIFRCDRANLTALPSSDSPVYRDITEAVPLLCGANIEVNIRLE